MVLVFTDMKNGQWPSDDHKAQRKITPNELDIKLNLIKHKLQLKWILYLSYHFYVYLSVTLEIFNSVLSILNGLLEDKDAAMGLASQYI